MSNSRPHFSSTCPRKRPRLQNLNTQTTLSGSQTHFGPSQFTTLSDQDNFTEVELGPPTHDIASTEALEERDTFENGDEFSDEEVKKFVTTHFTHNELQLLMPFVEEPLTPSDEDIADYQAGVNQLYHLLSQKFEKSGEEGLAQFALEMLFMYYFQYQK